MEKNTDQLIEKINDLSVHLAFDSIVATCSKRPELTASWLKYFGRRLLEVALFAVEDIKAKPDPSDIISDFETLTDRATALKKAGLELASHLAGKNFGTAASLLIATDFAAKPIFHMRRRQRLLTSGYLLQQMNRKRISKLTRTKPNKIPYRCMTQSHLRSSCQATPLKHGMKSLQKDRNLERQSKMRSRFEC